MYWRSHKKKASERKRSKTPLEKKHERVRALCSEYVRKRTADKFGNVVCVTCYMRSKIQGTILNKIHRKEGDAGHFAGRGRSNTLYDLENLNFQCRDCNRMEHGEQHLHGLYIDLKYGEGTAEAIQARKRPPKSWTMEELEELEEFFKKWIQEIHERLGRDKRRTVANKKKEDPNLLFAGL